MSIDTTTPRTRRALIAGALGGMLASVAALAKAPVTRAGVDGDVVLDDTNTGAGTTEILATGSSPAFRVLGGGLGIRGEASDGPGVIGVGPTGFVPDPIIIKAGVYGAAAAHPGVFGHGFGSPGVHGESDSADGVFGQTNEGLDGHPAHNPGAGVHGHGGLAGVLGTGDTSFGVMAQSNSVPAIFATNNSATAAAIVADGGPGTAIHGHANPGGVNQIDIPSSPALTGLFGSAVAAGTAIAASSENGLAVTAASSAGQAIRGHGQLDGVIGESGGDHTGVVGFSGAGAAPAGPDKTGVYGEATQDAASRGVAGRSTLGQGIRGDATSGQGVRGVATTGQGVRGDATTGVGVQATASTTGIAFTSTSVTGLAVWAQSTQGSAIKGRGQLDGVIGEAANGNSGLVGFSGAATAPPGPVKTGVYGEATQDSAARGVFGKSTLGQGVRGEATTGIGVQGVATTGVALGVSGRVVLNRSGRVSVPANRSYVDITVPGGLGAPANVFAMIQTNRVGVYVTGVLSNYPSAGKARIILNKVASTTLTTPVAWFVLN